MLPELRLRPDNTLFRFAVLRDVSTEFGWLPRSGGAGGSCRTTTVMPLHDDAFTLVRKRVVRSPSSWLQLNAFVMLTLSTFLYAAPAEADSRRSADQLRCVACHGGANQAHTGEGGARPSQRTINIHDFANADHGKMQCLDCHSRGFNTFPHRRPKTETCMDCHPRKDIGAEADRPYAFERIQAEFEDTLHFTEYRHAPEKCCGTAAGKQTAASAAAPMSIPGQRSSERIGGQRFTCEHCHEPHYFKATARVGEPALIRANDNFPCLQCHRDGVTGPLADPAASGLVAAHAYLPYARTHLETTRCIDCHTNVRVTVAHDLPLGKKADQGCNSCHSIDSVLITRLYRYVTGSGPDLGFHNAPMLREGYVMGANRHHWTDNAVYLLMSLGMSLVLAHGGWRVLTWWRATRDRP